MINIVIAVPAIIVFFLTFQVFFWENQEISDF
jgi:hypothetical protein